MSDESTYEVLAVRFGTRMGTKAEIYLNYGIYREADAPLQMDYYVWLARNSQRTIVIDTGFSFEEGSRRHRTTLADPVESLGDLGVDPAGVAQVIATHAHYDHIGNLDRFPAAEVIMTRAEFDFWTGPYGKRQQFAHFATDSEIAYLETLRCLGRTTLVARQHSPAPGIEVLHVGGHTPGQAVVLVNTAHGQVVLASDAVHYYEEIERDRPFAFVADLEAMYRTFDLLSEITADPGRVLVAGHDPDVMHRFAASEPLPGRAVRIG